MGRGRLKAKQTKIARKLKYLTTDTDYNELEKELGHHEDVDETVVDTTVGTAEPEKVSGATTDGQPQESEDLNDYAAWAAEAAKRAEETKAAAPKPHKPFPKVPGLMPKPKDK